MIEYLEELLEEVGQEKKALALAEDLLGNKGNSPRQVLAIQTAILRARATSGQYDLAIPPGNAAVELSKQLGEWDYFGIASLFLGTTFGRLGQYSMACHHLLEYINHLSLFIKAIKYQSAVWFNLGVFYIVMNKTSEASHALEVAARTSSVFKRDRWEHGIRQAIVSQLLRVRELDKVPGLLATCSYYLRHNVHPENKSSRLYHIESRTRYAWQTFRLSRARALALRGLTESSGDFKHLGALHMLTAHLAWEEVSVDDAIEFAVTARYYARLTTDSKLEDEAAGLLCKVSSITGKEIDGRVSG